MSLLEKTIKKIYSTNAEVMQLALERLRNQARPAGSLGILEPLAARLAAIAGSLNVELKRKVVVTCAGDHGVVAEGVSLFPQEVTYQMVFNFVNGGASINVLGKHAGAEVNVADFGVNYDFKPELPIFHKKVAKGTRNFVHEPAMSREAAISSIEGGIEIVETLLEAGQIDMLATGDMGIGNTTPSTAIIAAFSGLPVEELVGRGTGIGDEALKIKTAVIKKALALHQPDKSDPLEVLATVGGFEIGGLAGLVLGAAANGIPVVCDGLISTAGALIAAEFAPTAKEYLFASHRSVEAGHKFMHERLELTPVLDLQFRLGEGTGAVLAMELLDAATRILCDIKTFAEVAIGDKNIV
ncbi:MAG: nicotinate-nucleotide--dimethylbenzimidazole phosphoribosyltransferase [Victivallaceae bacterium]|nr:nicotinate-nucleotide--dimethylbenzimidazole phosphoribosyltransferase [Victivallaceae bacterium]